MPLRFDSGATVLRSPRKMANGWVRLDARIARTGIQEYRRPDGTVQRELRLAEEVFKEDALDSFALVPVTDEHPPERLLDGANAATRSRGSVGESIRQDGNFVVATVMVTDSELAKEVLAGKKSQVSCGYLCELEPAEPGAKHDGQPYDFVQRHIRGNHVAMVPVGRAGPDVSVRLDAEDAVVLASPTSGADDPKHQEKNDTMKKILIGGVWVEVSETAASLIEKETAAHQDALATAKGEAELKAKELEKLKGKLDSTEKELESTKKAHADAVDPKALSAKVQARVALEKGASKFLGAEKLDALSDRQVMEKVVTKLDPTFKGEGKSDAYVEGRFEGLIAAAGVSAAAGARAAVTNPATIVTDAGDAEAETEKKRAEMHERNRTAYKRTEPAKA